jgi:hypothetical protein
LSVKIGRREEENEAIGVGSVQEMSHLNTYYQDGCHIYPTCRKAFSDRVSNTAPTEVVILEDLYRKTDAHLIERE